MISEMHIQRRAHYMQSFCFRLATMNIFFFLPPPLRAFFLGAGAPSTLPASSSGPAEGASWS